MSDISLETVAGKLNPVGYEAFMQAHRQAKALGNKNVEIAHWLFHALSNDRSDMAKTLDGAGIDRARVLADISDVIAGFSANVTEMPGFSTQMIDALDRGWHYATLLFGEVQIRTGHALVGILKSNELRRPFQRLSKELTALEADQVVADARSVWAASDEETQRPMDGSGIAAKGDGDGAARGTTALDRFSIDMTAEASSGKMDPIVGRDEEIRQIIDVLMRRRQNNPILTGEAGVGKTAVVEGFAQKLASGDVPPALRDVRLHALDIGLMQAGASMKGEFEQRLRSVIDEVQAAPVPIILFIDEAHTLIGAGGAEGTGDAANLMKPALARGTLRTVAATTWAEYRKYFEKDPALTRRFQPVDVEEPSTETCAIMLRGILGPMEAHHQVRISDNALVAAVNLSARYIPARQLPDKAVSLLDTAAARVAISQNMTPAAIADLKATQAALESEAAALAAQVALGEPSGPRTDEVAAEMADTAAALAACEDAHAREAAIIAEITAMRDGLDGIEDPAAQGAAMADLADKIEALAAVNPDQRMIYAHVDAAAVASVVSDWTGIPVGRMVTDEIEAILNLPAILKERVVGQDHGLEMIAKRIETNRANLDNPNKPIGVFMLAGPSGVGKTETALALAEAIYGGEQNIITINMSEFQEAHSVSLLKGAPPGYVGYGEGGRLTEAVRRKPYSVVLLDEVEKAHSDVHELFFQVFDKGQMEDGTGRMIDFKNTVILLTSNVGTEAIMAEADEGRARPDLAALDTALKPHLQRVFPPALLGRIVTIPYFPLSGDALGKIIALQLGRIVRRVADNHGATLRFSDGVVDHIASQCNDPDSGGRMIDNIITNAMLPDLSREILSRTIAQKPFTSAAVDVMDGAFIYDIS